MTKKPKKEHSDLLYESILTLQDLDECRKFFEDLCTCLLYTSPSPRDA